MFISVLDLFKIGIGPSSSHIMGPMVAAGAFSRRIREHLADQPGLQGLTPRCVLKSSLAYTGQGHATDRAVLLLGLHGYTPRGVADADLDALVARLQEAMLIPMEDRKHVGFVAERDIVFDRGRTAAGASQRPGVRTA